jgi:hypothetical protein
LVDQENDGDRCGCRLGNCCRRAIRDDHGHLSADQIGRQCYQAIALIVGPAVFDRDGLAFDIASFLQAVTKPPQTLREPVRRLAVEKSDYRHRRLLRARDERPRGCRAERG